MASQDETQHTYTTYRVLGVNKKWDGTKLQSFLEGRGDDIKPEILSLALEPDGRSQTATVVFENNKVPSSPIRPEKIVIEKTFHGITPLFTPPKEYHKIDIIAVSGLNGHAFGSFKERDGDHMWLRDSLPEDLRWGQDEDDDQPMARILIYGYDSPLHESTSFQSVEDIASSFRLALHDCRLRKPIIFIAHSLGGILVKQVLVHWSTSKEEKHQSLLQAVRGIVFFAVPHNGMDITSLIPMAKDVNRSLLETLSRHNPQFLTTQRREFMKALGEQGDTEVFCFYETRQSPTAQKDEENTGKWKMDERALAVLVDQPSATICRPWEDGSLHVAAIDRSHSEVVKFRLHDPEYKKVRGRLSDLCERAIEKDEKQKVPIVKDSKGTLNRRKHLMNSLKFPQIDERLSTVKHAHKKTYKWILDDPAFRCWQESTYIPEQHRMIWIKGNPGAGKSTLMKFTYNRIRESAGGNTFVTSFFFNARGADLEKATLGLYQSLLWHLLDQFVDLQVVFDDTGLFDRHREACSLIELQDLLHGAVLLLGQRSLIWFIDALDECEEDEVADMVYYFEELVASTLENGINLAICFSSRHYPAIRIQRAAELVLDGNPDHEKDLNSYVTDRLRVNDTTVVNKVLAKASGVFLWAVLVVDILNKEDLEGGFAMNHRLEEVPNDLRGLFKDLLGQKTSNKVKDETTKLSLLWLLFAKHSLTPIQYWNAIWGGLSSKGMLKDEDSPLSKTGENARDCADKYVVSSSKGLAQVTTTMSGHETVQLIHESVRDYLLKERGLAKLWPEFEADIVGLSHAALQQSCMGYWRHWLKSAPQVLDNESDLDDHGTFVVYVIKFVLDHAEAAADVIPQHEFLSTFPITNYVSAQRRVKEWSFYREQAGLLYVLAFHGHEKLITAFLQLEDAAQRIAERPGKYRFPIIAAAVCGEQGAFNALLSSEADVYVGADLVKEFNSDEDWRHLQLNRVQAESLCLFTPLSWAAAKGHTNMASKLVLQYQEPINETDLDGRTPLSWAATSGNEAIVRLLIEQGADIKASDALAIASLNGHETIVQLLIEKGAGVNSGNPLAHPSLNGHETLAQLLTKLGASVDDGNPPAQALVPDR